MFFGTIDELERAYEHFSVIKVPAEIETDLKTIYSKTISFIDINERYAGIVAYDEKQQKSLIEMLSQKGIGFQCDENCRRDSKPHSFRPCRKNERV